MRAVRISERDVHPRIFLILQNLTDDIFEFDVGANRKLADTVAILVGVSIFPEIVLQFAVGRVGLRQAISLT